MHCVLRYKLHQQKGIQFFDFEIDDNCVISGNNTEDPADVVVAEEGTSADEPEVAMVHEAPAVHEAPSAPMGATRP